MDVLKFIIEVMDACGTMAVLLLSALLYIILRRPIQRVMFSITDWRRRTTRIVKDDRIVRRVRAVIGSLGAAPIEVISNEIRTIIAMGELAVQPLTEALKHRHPRVRWIAAKALGEINDPDAIVPLIRASGDRDSSVRLTIVTTLGNSADLRVIEPLVLRLKDRDHCVQLAALVPFAAGKIKNSLAVAPIMDLLKDNESSTRADAAKALGEIADPRAVRPLVELLSDPDWGVQEQAIRALREIKDTYAVEALIVALSHETLYMRREAAKALASIGDGHAVEPLRKALSLDENEEIADILASALKKLEK
ncbi:MAG: HEAT repeat domain-containing protein [Candidatus Omnitrophica bacterium]|nr:HEAT repeat domain-containing protein [Candidatus Omnitrophota bacterium]